MLLKEGNGHQKENRKVAMAFLLSKAPEVVAVDERTIDWPGFGRCHFAAYTNKLGAMISTPNRDDNEFGRADWHASDKIVMFRDPGDGRVIIYICPIQPLFGLRTIGHHGVRWPDVLKASERQFVFRL